MKFIIECKECKTVTESKSKPFGYFVLCSHCFLKLSIETIKAVEEVHEPADPLKIILG